jgi:hypothetical protein
MYQKYVSLFLGTRMFLGRIAKITEEVTKNYKRQKVRS